MPDYDFSADWFTRRLPEWETYVRPLAGKPLEVLELGCYEGRASVWFLEDLLTHPQSCLTAVDTFEGSAELTGDSVRGLRERFASNVAQTGKGDQVRTMQMTTSQALAQLIHANAAFDVIYVDASHKASDVLTDAVMASQILKPGGLLIFDDYLWEVYPSEYDRPRIAIDAFMSVMQPDFETLHKDYQVFLRRKTS